MTYEYKADVRFEIQPDECGPFSEHLLTLHAGYTRRGDWIDLGGGVHQMMAKSMDLQELIDDTHGRPAAALRAVMQMNPASRWSGEEWEEQFMPDTWRPGTQRAWEAGVKLGQMVWAGSKGVRL